jgi:hypothetical protein
MEALPDSGLASFAEASQFGLSPGESHRSLYWSFLCDATQPLLSKANRSVSQSFGILHFSDSFRFRPRNITEVFKESMPDNLDFLLAL